MEGKTVILSVLIMSLAMVQIQVEAKNVCCPSKGARYGFGACHVLFGNNVCAADTGCKIVDGKCPKGYPYDMLENSGDAVNEYCKLGCTSSVCGAMEALQNSAGSEIVNGAVEKCAKACSTLCTKGSTAGVGTV